MLENLLKSSLRVPEKLIRKDLSKVLDEDTSELVMEFLLRESVISSTIVYHQRVAYRNSMDSGRLVNFLDFSDRSGSGAAANRTISTTRARMRQTSYWQNMFAKKCFYSHKTTCTYHPKWWRWSRFRDPNPRRSSKNIENPRKSMKNHDLVLVSHGRIRGRFQTRCGCQN